VDTFAALALATDSPTRDLLNRRPYGKNDSIIARTMWRNIIVQVVFQLIVINILLFVRVSREGNEYMFLFPPTDSDSGVMLFSIRHLTITFNTFVFLQIFNEICCRKCYNELNFFQGIFQNWLFMFVMTVTVLLQVIIIEVPGIQVLFFFFFFFFFNYLLICCSMYSAQFTWIYPTGWFLL
jgi:Ca2+ transporting ATPase